MKLYRAYGLTIRSALEIPGAVVIADGAGRADIVIAEGPVAAGSGTRGLTHLTGDGRVTVELSRAVRFLCAPDAIIFERVAGASDRMIGGFLIATALPAVLWMRGEIVLHAAAVMLPGTAGALAIMGASRSGKSTALRALLAVGARIVADDTICVRRTAVGIEASGLPGGYFLGGRPRAFHAVEDGVDAAPLAGILLLTPRTGEKADIRKLPRIEGLTGLIAHRHRPRIPVLLGRRETLMIELAELAGVLPIHAWKRREGDGALAPGELALLGELGI